jgi:TPR repeat protein
MAHDVFISYSKNDKATADAVCHALEADGIRCWIAPRDVSPGLSWKQSIVDAIREARTMVLIFSGEANGSPQVRREVDIAFESGHPILPFRIEDVEMNKDLYYCIAARHWLDALTDPKDEQIGELVVSVRGLVGPEQAAGSSAGEAEGPPEGAEISRGPDTPPSQPAAPSRPATARPAKRETKRLAAFLGRRAARRVMIGAVGVAAFLGARALLTGPSTAELTEQGVAAYDAEDYSAALPFLVQAADKGDPEAEYMLGRMYFNGNGVAQDVDRAYELFQASADESHPGGQTGIGFLYSVGEAVELDDEEALRWYRLAADQGFAAAQANLGYMYQNGRGVAASDEEAVRWYRVASDQGYARAQAALGFMYQQGLGVGADPEEAMRLYRLAAEQGNVNAQVNLGVMYDRGEGVPRSYSEQVKWYELAAEQLDSTAENNLEILRNRAWAAAELIPGSWTTLEGEARSSELGLFDTEAVAGRLKEEGWDLERVRVLPLRFYDEAVLHEIELRREDERGVFDYVRIGSGTESAIWAINGSSASVHQLNAEARLRVGSIHQAVDYMRFYIGAIQADEGRFQVVEQVDDLLWIDPSPNGEGRDAVAGKLRLLDIFEDDEGGWLGSGTVVYGSGVYDADFEVLESGMVNMLNDTPIATDLPIHAESFDENGVRTRAEVEEDDEEGEGPG